MCGITASLTLQRSAPTNCDVKRRHETLTNEIDDSLDIVKHRGPDARGQWISADGRVGLGHVRLSIIDLSPDGNQPFHDSEDEIHAVVNGELYDHERYRAELAKEYKFKGQSDCEIVIALYKRYGLSLLPHLRGEFAFVLWDSKRQLLFAGRDRYGIKSLYYTVIGGRLLVATEMKSFLAFGWQPEWDVVSLVENGFMCDHRTFFKGVYKVLPGHYLLNKQYTGIETQPYWDLDYPDKHVKETRTEEEMVAGIQERLVEAVKLRLRADVPVGIYLSGGLDSSAVAGITAHLIKEQGTRLGDDASQDLSRMKCFTVQFDKDSGRDESEIARRTAEWLGVQFVPVELTEETMAKNFEDVAWYSEMLCPDVNGMGKLAMSERVHAEGLKVVLTGEGSDEHFTGYRWFFADMLREPDHSWPTSSFPPSPRDAVIADAENKGKIFFSPYPNPRPDSTAEMLNHTSSPEIMSRLIPVSFAPWVREHHPATSAIETVIVESFPGTVHAAIAGKWHPMHTAQYSWTKTALPNMLLRYLGDNVDMVNHVESRTPFLDHHLTAYANTLPPSLKMRYDPTTATDDEKHLLKRAVRPFVTDEIFRRKKWPFLGPVRYPRDGPMHRLLQGLVTREAVEGLGFLDWGRVEGLAERAFGEGKDGFAFRELMVVGQLVAVGRRFGVRKAEKGEGEGGEGAWLN